jgi:hypothetical protein
VIYVCLEHTFLGINIISYRKLYNNNENEMREGYLDLLQNYTLQPMCWIFI